MIKLQFIFGEKDLNAFYGVLPLSLFLTLSNPNPNNGGKLNISYVSCSWWMWTVIFTRTAVLYLSVLLENDEEKVTVKVLAVVEICCQFDRCIKNHKIFKLNQIKFHLHLLPHPFKQHCTSHMLLSQKKMYKYITVRLEEILSYLWNNSFIFLSV